jgi:hypothetical protein
LCGSARIVVLKSNSDLKDYLKFIIANILPHLLFKWYLRLSKKGKVRNTRYKREISDLGV